MASDACMQSKNIIDYVINKLIIWITKIAY